MGGLNELHVLGDDVLRSIDVWPWHAAGAFRLVSAPSDVLLLEPGQTNARGTSELSPVGPFKEGDVPVHGVLLWLRREAPQPGDQDVAAALMAGDASLAARLR